MLEDWRIITAVLGGLTALVAAAVWVGRMTEFKSATTRLLEEIRDDVKKIFDRLPPSAVASGSPLRLTDLQGGFHPEPEQESLLKQVAYENGIDQEQVLNVLMVVLRDLLLETRGESH